MPRHIIRQNTHALLFTLMSSANYGANRSTDEFHILPTGNNIQQTFAPLDRTFKHQLFQAANRVYQRQVTPAIDEGSNIGTDLSQEIASFLPHP